MVEAPAEAAAPQPMPRRSRRRLPRWRSLRVRALLVVLAVVLTPLVLVWWADLVDQNAGTVMRQRVHLALDQGGEAYLEDPDRVEDIARRHRVWARVLHPEAGGGWAVVSSHDHEADLGDAVEAWFFPPEDAPSLRRWDAEQPELSVRPEVIVAEREDQGSRCTLSAREDLLVCSAALLLDDDAGEPRILHVQQSSRRAIRTLHDQRYQMVKLTLVVAVVGVVLGVWLGWRFVRPIEDLRRQIADRRARRSTAPVQLPRDDELGDLATSFNGLLEALEERTAANEAFAADLAHELKNPLAAIRAAAEALDRDTALPPHRARRLARVLAGSSERLDTLVSRFLELARAEAGLAHTAREAVDLELLCRNVAAALEPGLDGVALSVDAPGPVVVQAVAERLETLVRNLVENAAQHAGQGSGSPEVRLILRAGRHRATLRVCDSGPGVAEADSDRVFDRFFSRRAGGTGLGLALSRAIAEAHGGTLTVDRGPLPGACFVLRLPLAAPAPGGGPGEDGEDEDGLDDGFDDDGLLDLSSAPPRPPAPPR